MKVLAMVLPLLLLSFSVHSENWVYLGNNNGKIVDHHLDIDSVKIYKEGFAKYSTEKYISLRKKSFFDIESQEYQNGVRYDETVFVVDCDNNSFAVIAAADYGANNEKLKSAKREIDKSFLKPVQTATTSEVMVNLACRSV